jgi:Holliday junction resolvase RusA-like endonuclease
MNDKISTNRIKRSFGQCHFNNGEVLITPIEQYEIDYTKRFYIFDVIPMGAVRMSQSDRWKTNPNHTDPNKRQRQAVTEYFEFKNKIKAQAEQMNFQLPEILDIVFLIPMPFTWSEKKKVKHNKTKVMKRPDLDNLVKAFMDALSVEDGYVWKITAEKRYSFSGSILVYA